jgi:cobalt-precorrin 5A hydrolase/precorrin-3B C17-methyltransferase
VNGPARAATPTDHPGAAPAEVLAVSLTAAGKALVERLPYARRHGELATSVRDAWGRVDGFVLVAPVGLAVRVVAPLLVGKQHDPAVVCVDEAGRWAVAVVGGHGGGANALAREVAGLLGAEAVVTTASDAAGLPALDLLVGFVARGDVAGATRRLLDGDRATLRSELPWPLPAPLVALADGRPPARAVEAGGPPVELVVTDRTGPERPGTVRLHPPSLVAGVGSSRGVAPAEVRMLLEETLAEAGLADASVSCVATLDRKASEAGIVALGLPLRAFPAEVLAPYDVPSPSDVVAATVGTPSVAEAAALAAAGPGAELIVPKRRSAMATVAVARRAGPEGHLAVVGLGPGHPAHRTPAASAAVRGAEVVIGYRPYVEQCADLLVASQEVVSSPIGQEADRCRDALQRAASGQRVALVCSGDAGVYAMASLVLDLAPAYGHPPVDVIPGVTAALAAAALLGAPLGHDHAAVSLSDLLTPWEVIERRLRAVAEADFVVTLYNPRSARRTHQLEAARRLLAGHRPPSTPVGVVTDVGRPTQRLIRTCLADLDPTSVDMLTCVVVGASSTRWVGGRMVTPRGYRP